ncbi:MAG: hypothetical protein QW666_03080 [Candidatus Woesearchaeota archaeon]
MEEKGIALTILAIVAILAIVGFVLLFTKAQTGKFIYAGGHVQYEPKEACERIGCTFVTQQNAAFPYAGEAGTYSLCNCPGEAELRQVPLVVPMY